MEFGVDCVACLFNKEIKRIEKYEEGRKKEYINQIMQILIEDHRTAPEYQYHIDAKREGFWGSVPDIYEQAKREHTSLMLLEEEKFVASMRASERPLERAIKIAGAGNYIDMGAMENVEIPHLLACMQDYMDSTLDSGSYEAFYEDLKKSKTFIYLTDNCGEVVLDKILIRAIREEFPHLDMCAIVRGRPVLNDVTMEDAAFAGLMDHIEVMDNGAGIAGTSMMEISEEARVRIESADVILAKGQGNFETLSGCGLNIYYLLLCKCEYFAKKLERERMSMAFINEKNLL